MSEERKNRCYTYFRIAGDFDPEEITKRLGLLPEEQWKIGDDRRNGSQFDFAGWKIGECAEYDEIVTNQMRKTIAPLRDKTEILRKIHDDFDAALVLEIVPTIHPGETEPALAPDLDIIDFCCKTRTEIDIDLCLEYDDPNKEKSIAAP